jgi:hypothetical protein
MGSLIVPGRFSVERGGLCTAKINTHIFKQPDLIAANIRLLQNYLAKEFPEYLFVGTLPNKAGKELTVIDGAYYRLFPFIAGSHTLDVLESPGQALEAARQFGAFTKCLEGIDVSKLNTTLPDFHDLPLRYNQFKDSMVNGNAERIKECKDLIDQLSSYHFIVAAFIKMKDSLVIRCTHHDTKISNVLFNANGKGLCVVDLDTVMPGYFISDVGDMMRTYLSPVSEEVGDLDKIVIRPAFYEAIKEGYLSAMRSNLTRAELAAFDFSGQYMIYMQALRFLTDHLLNDIYYGAKYPGQNLVRATNQACLLEKLMAFQATSN